MKLIDTHSHLYEPEFDDDREAAVARAREAGVAALLLPAIDTASDRRLFDLCRSHPEYCFPMIGLHPTSVNDNPAWREELARVERYLLDPPAGIRFCAIGEIGLDYYWSDAFVAQQTEAFVAQLRLAARFDLPVAIHTRGSSKPRRSAPAPTAVGCGASSMPSRRVPPPSNGCAAAAISALASAVRSRSKRAAWPRSSARCRSIGSYSKPTAPT